MALQFFSWEARQRLQLEASVIINTYTFYQFQKVSVNELVGVVVRLNGKFYCHEIEKSWDKP